MAYAWRPRRANSATHTTNGRLYRKLNNCDTITGAATVRDLDYALLADGSAVAADHLLPVDEAGFDGAEPVDGADRAPANLLDEIGEDQADPIYGGLGDDELYGGFGSDHIYGEKEVGGTNVFYLTKPKVAFASLGLQDFDYKAVSGLTESIQHRIFQYFIPPIAVYSILGGIMAYNQRRKKDAGKLGGDDEY